MVKVLAEEAIRLGIPFYNHTTAVKILTEGEGASRRVCGVLTVRPKQAGADNPFGLVLFQCPVLVLAAGGPGELYRDSVYPNGCFGSLGLALDAGIELVNLTESQFGIGTRREGFPWNLSGTYVQALPHIYSVDASGREHHFLADYYRTTQELASNVFRKGYQWPFHATRMLDFGSSLVDLAIYRETAGRAPRVHGLQPQPAARPRRRALQPRPPRRRRARLSRHRRRDAGAADRPPAAHEPARDRALPPLQDRHRRRAAGVRRQQPAHERRHRRRHLGPQQPARRLRGRRGRRHPRRDPPRRRRAQRRPGLRHARRRARRRQRPGDGRARRRHPPSPPRPASRGSAPSCGPTAR